MAINRYMKAALAALSYADIDIKKNYKLIRKIETAAKKPRLKLMYQMWDHKIEGCGHEMLVPRLKIERHIKRIHRQDDTL